MMYLGVYLFVKVDIPITFINKACCNVTSTPIRVMLTTTKLATAIHQSMDWKSSVFDNDILLVAKNIGHTVFLGKILFKEVLTR